MMVNAQFTIDSSLNSIYGIDNPVILSRSADQQAAQIAQQTSDSKQAISDNVSYIELLLAHSSYSARWLIALEISADELTPLAYSKARIFRASKYGLFVEICEDSIVYTIRKFGKNRLGESGYFQIIEQESDNFELFYFNSWSIYVNE